MLKITINNEEVVSNKDFTIEEEMLNTSSVILNNVYPKSWENDKDYVSRFYHPNDYSKCLIKDEDYTPAEPGLNEEGTNFQITADTTKLNELTSMKGNTSQSGTPTPTAPVPINVVSGRQDIVVAGKNLLNEDEIVVGFLGTNGQWSPSVTSWSTTPYIPIKASTTYSFSFTPITTGTYWQTRVVYYDNTMTYVSGTDLSSYPSNYTYSITTPQNVSYMRISFTNTGNYQRKEFQLEKGTKTSYEAYNGNTYEINLGKNLYYLPDPTTSNQVVYSINNDGTFNLSGTATGGNATFMIYKDYAEAFINNGEQYTLSSNQSLPSGVEIRLEAYNGTTWVRHILGGVLNSSNQTRTSTANTTNSTRARYLIYVASGTTVSINNLGIQLEKGTKTTYAPYKTPIELGKIGNYQDRIYKENGKWYIEKQIGKLILDGSEIGWVAQSTSTAGLYRYNYNFLLKSGYQNAISSHFEMSEETSFANINTVCFATHPSNHMFCFFVNNDSVDTWRAWLTNNNVTVYYVLETTTTTEIIDTDLINQLNSIKLFNGLNNISISSGDLTSPLNIDYYSNSVDYEFQPSDYSTLDGGLIEYGPINSVILGNKNISGENIVREDNNDIVRDGEHSIFIDAEYFLFNQSLREQAIDGIWNKLYGFRYYDLSLSTPYGKPFLEVGDKIRVNTNEGNVYDTYILSHKFTFDGTFKTELNSPAFTEQEQIVKSTNSISNSIKRTEIMVDKANQEIVSVVQSSEELAGIVNSQGENIESLGTRLTQTVDNFTASISSLQEQVDDGVNYVKTTSVTINDDGLSVSTDTSRIKTTMTNNEFKITDSGETVLAKFGYDETVQNSIAEMDNLTVKNFLVLGNHRVEKCGTNKERTGFFYIGG